jgi:hypothetical protein
MRDIRSDLQERGNLIEEQIRAAHTHFDKIVEQLENERDARLADLKSGLAMIGKFIEFEQRYMGTAATPPSLPQLPLSDFFVRKLNEIGPMSKDDLIDLAVKEAYYPDTESAVQGVPLTLTNMLRSEQIRQLPNGTFAPPTLSQTIKLRRVT